MATASHTWYVRLPDGRTLRARNADIVRDHLHAGRISIHSQVRRSGEEIWQPLEGIAEFTEALPAADEVPDGPRTAVSNARAAGIRTLLGEMLGAFDRSLDRAKLTVAAIIGVLLAVVAIAFELFSHFSPAPWGMAGYVGTAIFLLAVVAVGTVLLTQMTLIELDRRRPARAAELRTGLGRQSLRVFLAQAFVAAVLLGMLIFFRAAGPWLAAINPNDDFGRDMAIGVAAVARLLVEVLCWPLLGTAILLLGPSLVIEEHSIVRGLRAWLGMLRRHFGRIYICEAIAFTLAIMVAMPMLLPVAIAAYSLGDTGGPVERITLLVLGGVALTPMIAYLIVANVFIYLNVRYDFFHAQGDR